jgi:hypothetical protein
MLRQSINPHRKASCLPYGGDMAEREKRPYKPLGDDFGHV